MYINDFRVSCWACNAFVAHPDIGQIQEHTPNCSARAHIERLATLEPEMSLEIVLRTKTAFHHMSAASAVAASVGNWDLEKMAKELRKKKYRVTIQ